jgi:hypothetical protein
MTPVHTTTRTQMAMPGSETSKAPRCEHTMLTKPECHCPACLAALVASRGAGISG